MVEQVERVGCEFQAITLGGVDFTNQPEISGSVVGPSKSITAVPGKAVVVVVAVLVRIAGDGGVDGASAAGGDDAGNFPIVQHVAEKRVFAVKGTRLNRKSRHKAVALICDAG